MYSMSSSCCVDRRFRGGLGVAERAVVFSKVGNLVGLRDLQPMLDVGFVATAMQSPPRFQQIRYRKSAA